MPPVEDTLPVPEAQQLPTSVLYSISARIGGSGLDTDSFETIRGLYRAGILGRAVAYDNRQTEVPGALIESLRWHPVRLLSWLDSSHYYGVKKHYLDSVVSRMIATGDYDLFHGWSGECVRTLRQAKLKGIPTVLEIPTWHRDKGKVKPVMSRRQRERSRARTPQRFMDSLLISRQQTLEEYELADMILVLSQRAEETFLAAGVPQQKLFQLPRATDTDRFTPGTPPPIFRAIFVGALIRRKGVHYLLEAWSRLRLKDAELLLVGTVHDEIEPFLQRFASDSVKVIGWAARPEDYYRTSSVHIFPSTCEGSAKVTYDAAACGLPQITTRESGDVVVDGLNGIVVPYHNVEALMGAIERLYHNPDLMVQMGAAARRRVVENFTWDHLRARLLIAYAKVLNKTRTPPTGVL